MTPIAATRPSARSTRTLETLDGVPQNDPFGNWVIWAAIPQIGLSHVHVARGVGAAHAVAT
ncbi:MAG TPA: hypothetical protein VN042_00915 [Asticcacaulis sp.]|nr:hypothetical protein [Asticcacaulis sp.]